MAVFDPSKSGGLILKSYGSQSILADPSQEMMRLPQITLAVKELATALEVYCWMDMVLSFRTAFVHTGHRTRGCGAFPLV